MYKKYFHEIIFKIFMLRKDLFVYCEGNQDDFTEK